MHRAPTGIKKLARVPRVDTSRFFTSASKDGIAGVKEFENQRRLGTGKILEIITSLLSLLFIRII